MSALTKMLSAAGITLVFAMPAFAQQGSNWEMEEGPLMWSTCKER